MAPPADAAFRLPTGARLLVELHYRGRGSAIEDLPAGTTVVVTSTSPRADGPPPSTTVTLNLLSGT